MTQNASSPSSAPRSPKLTWDRLLASSDQVDRVLDLLRGPAWQALVDLMEVERQGQLEALVSSDTPEKMLQHQAVAQWIAFFMNDLKTEVINARLDQARGSVDPDANDAAANPYMESDSESRPEETT